jgi:prophage regulatory protein
MKRFLRLTAVMDLVPYSRPTLYRLMKLNLFPKPYPLGGRAVAWLASDIEAWIAQRVEIGHKAASVNSERDQKVA